MADDASSEKIRRIEGLSACQNPSLIDVTLRNTRKTDFKITKRRCYPIRKYGSVHFCVFNPVSPILACGLNDGIIMIFEGLSYQTPYESWISSSEKYKVENLSAITDMMWNVLLVKYN